MEDYSSSIIRSVLEETLQQSGECFAYERKTHREGMHENLLPGETEPTTREREMSSKNSFPPLK